MNDDGSKTNISGCLIQMHKTGKHRYRGGLAGHYVAALLLVALLPVLIPFFLFLWLGSRAYFWLCREQPVPLKPFFHFDRHKVAHLKFLDKISCEYCEWANGMLQWALEMANKVERRFCPIQNSCDPHCEKAKGWRQKFLPFDHSEKEMEEYYKKYPPPEPEK